MPNELAKKISDARRKAFEKKLPKRKTLKNVIEEESKKIIN
jgi:hypothetical protein